MAKKRGEEANSESSHGAELEKKIIENMVELQKVQTNLAEKFNKLSDQLGALLTLFEMAARSFAQSPANQVTERDKQFLEKIDKLLEQNKTIAKGLTMMEERAREKVYGPGNIVPPAKSFAQAPPPSAELTQFKPEEEFKPSLDGRALPKF